VKDIMEFMVRLVDVNRDGKLQRSEVMNLAQQMAKISSITAHAVLDSSMEAWLEIVKANVPGEIVTKEQIAQMKAEVPEEVNFSGELLEHPMFLTALEAHDMKRIPGAKEIATDVFKAFTGWLDDILTHKSGDTCTNAQWQKISGKTVKSFINFFQTIAKHLSEAVPKMDPSLEEPMKAIGAKPADAQIAVNGFLDILSKNTFQIGEASFEFFKFGNAGAGEVSWTNIELFAAIFKPGKGLKDKVEEWANSCAASGKVSASSALTTTGTAGFMLAHAIATMFIEGCVTFLAEPAAEQFIATLSGGGTEFLILPTMIAFIMVKDDRESVDDIPAELKEAAESAGAANITKQYEILKKEAKLTNADMEAHLKKYHSAVMESFK